ncbi:MAG TPA: hypothetical protein VGS98_06685 [Thermoanaerobaculia bacterium]|jgi:hypothetical protein|nr:hypothetical protein [Thermoanaerobaculia bacterium]
MIKSRFARSLFLGAAAAILAVSTASAAGPFQFYSVTPCRIADTRNPSNPQGTGGPALSAGAPRNFPIVGVCGVPTDAKAAALNVTVVSPTLEGFIKIWPFNTAMPAVSTINFAAGEPAIANGAIVPLTVDPTFQISVVYGTAVPGGNTHLILDVTGYFK